MAFNNLGNYTISPGAGNALEILYWFGGRDDLPGGDDHGAQYCMAHPEAAPGTMFVFEQGKEQSSEQFNGQVVYIYHVKVRLDGPHENIFNLQGGGLT